MINNFFPFIRAHHQKRHQTMDPFEIERNHILHKGVRIGALLAAILVPLFGILDYVLKPDLFFHFMLIRIGVMVTSFCIFLLLKTTIGKKYPYIFGSLMALVVSGSVTLMCLMDQGPADPYYAGINLPLLGFGILLPLSLMEGLFVFLTVWMIYFVPNLLILTNNEIPLFISNNFFVISTVIVAFISTQFNLYYRKKQWSINIKLEKANQKIQNHSNELQAKVEERTNKLLQSERLAVVGQLAGGIAHDFNNHLTAILGVCELLLNNKNLTRELHQDVICITKAGRRATGLIRQLLAFSKQQILEPKVVNLNSIITEVEKLLNHVIGEDISLTIHLDSLLKYVRVDPIQVEQIILNLAINARAAMPNGGVLLIETTNIKLGKKYCIHRHLTLAPGEYILLSVSDSGCGMSEDVRQKIFEPFFTTKAPGTGTGLGLSSVYGIVKQTYGDILVYSEENIGTTFKIYLPSFDHKHTQKQQDTKAITLPKGTETILLVEDEESIRILTAKLLKKQGYRIFEASDAIEALKIAHTCQETINLLMTDVVLPRMSGPELANKITEIFGHMKVLYFSGYTTNFVLKKGLLEKTNTFIQKPFTMQSLSNKVREVIDRG